MSNASKSAEAVLATVVVARRRIDQLATRHLSIERALAFEIKRTVGFSDERQQLDILSSIFDRRINLLRRSLYLGSSKILSESSAERIKPSALPIEDIHDAPSPRGLRTIALNGSDPDDVTLTDSDQVQLILDADDHEDDEAHAAMMEVLAADDSLGDAAAGLASASASHNATEEETVAINLTPEDVANIAESGDATQDSDDDSDAQDDRSSDDMEDDIAWIVEGRPLPESDDEALAVPESAPQVDADSFLREASESADISPEDELDRLVIEELERARSVLVSTPEPDVDGDDDQDTDEDADIRHLLSDDEDEPPISLDVAEGDDFSHLVIDEDEALSPPAAETSDFGDLLIEDPDRAPLLVEEDLASADGLVVEDEDPGPAPLLVEEDPGPAPLLVEEDPGPAPLLVEEDLASSAGLVAEVEDSGPLPPPPITLEEPFGDFVINEEGAAIDSPGGYASLLVDDATAAAVDASQAAAARTEDGLEESTVLMDSSALLRALAPTPAPPRTTPTHTSPSEQELQPHGAAIQLLGTGQARTLGHTLELEAADDEEDFANEWDSDEDSDEVSSTGGLSITLEEEYEEEPLIPRLTDAHEIVEDDVSDVADYVEDINQDEITHGLSEARKIEGRGDLQNAIILYSDVLDLDPTSVEARMGRGRCTMELGDYAAAISDFQRAEDLDPTSPMPTREMGNLFYARKDYRRAIEFYTQAINLDPSQALARVRRGMSFYYRKEYQKALTDLERAYTMDPTIPGLTASINKVGRAMDRR